MKLNDHFDLREFVPPQIWNKYTTSSIRFIDPKIVAIATAYREFFDVPIIINNWWIGGKYMYRGFRPARVNFGAEESQHKHGRAFDCHSPNMTPQEMYQKILDNFDHFKQHGLTTLENIKFTETWLHSDCRWTMQDAPLIVNPL